MNRVVIFAAGAAILLMAFLMILLLPRSERSSTAGDDSDTKRTHLLRLHAPSLGPADAKVQIVEFLDPACEACRAFYPFVKSLMAAHPDKIRLSIRHVGFHEGADFAVRVLEAARKQGKYWETLERLLASQSSWAINHRVQPELVLARLDGLGLDLERLKADLKDPEIARRIAIDRDDAQGLRVTKTPEFFVNGRQMATFGREQLAKLVADEIAKMYP
ncbi:MAG: thioredoxin domain-containing protein [Burkholderiaceae bacterium]|nr:thioredoxin domain-containing protein [Burkholderiaceae bacterium]